MPLNNFGIAPFGFRCAQPDEQGIKDLVEMGVIAVYKLNNETPEESDWCKAANVTFINNPIPTFSNTVETVKGIVQDLSAWVTASISPSLLALHCQLGRDRTGLIVAAYRILEQGWTYEEAQAERQAFGVTSFVENLDNVGHMDLILQQLSNKGT